MANKQIPQLPAAAATGDADLLVVSQGGATRRKSVEALRAEAFADAQLPAAPQGGLSGATVRAQLGELDARAAANSDVAMAAQSAATAAQTAASSAQAAAGGKVDKAGDTMTGPLTVPAGTQAGHAVNKGQLDAESARAQAAEQAAASTATAAPTAASAAQTAANAAVPKAAASTATPAADVQLYGKDNAGNPLTTLVSNLQSAWLGGTNAGEVARTLGGKLRDAVSVRDFGAKGDGATDDSAAFQAALDACMSVYVPAGQYVLGSEIQVKPRRTITGAGRDGTLLIAQGPRAFTFNLNAGAYTVEPAGTPDWNRSRIGQLSIRMAAGGILVHGHEFHAHGIRFSGGAPSGWCLELVDSNECSLREIAAGTGGGNDDLLANGIHLYGSTANPAVNYGDSLIEEVSIKLKSQGTVGILLEHQGAQQANGSYYVVNNVLLNRVQVNSATVPTGTVGIWLKRVVRTALVNVDVEFLDTAYKVEGVAGGGNSGSTRHVSFVNCYVLNCNTPWTDSNASLAGSVMRCFFTNCNGFSPVGPVGVSSTDVNAKAGEGDVVLPAALWYAEPTNGQPAIQMRAVNDGQLLITHDNYDGSSPARDTNAKNKTPQEALGIDITGANATQLYRPPGYATGAYARIVVGNGEAGIKPDGTNYAPLHRIEIADPLYLPARQTTPPEALNGMLVYVDTPGILPAGSPWIGPGFYSRLTNGWWPGTHLPGRVIDKEHNSSLTITPADFGQLKRMNSASNLTVTINSTYTSGSTSVPLLAPTDPDAVIWFVRQGTGSVTIQTTDANTTIFSADGTATMKIARQYQVVGVWMRWNPTSSKLEVYSTSFPDADFSYNEQTAWTNANQGTNTDSAPYVVSSSRAGQLVRISSSDTVSYVAFDQNSVPAGLSCAMFRLVTLNNPINIMAKSGSGLILKRTSGTSTPGAFPIYQVAEKGRVVTVHVSASTDANQPNAIYVEG